jgi:hypothetical protein
MLVAAALLTASLAGSVDLVWIDPAEMAPFSYETARDEATESLREAGVAARWRRGAPSQVLRPEEVAVVLLPGDSPQSQKHRRILGAAKKGEDAVAAVWIYVSAVKWTLGLERARFSAVTTAQRMALGRALGRVAAHETLHALLPRLPHAASGLMSEQFDRTSLLAPRLSVDPATQAAVLGLATERGLETATASLIYSDKPLESLDLPAKAHLVATSAPLHGPAGPAPVPSNACHTSSDPFRRVAPATSSAETLPVGPSEGPNQTVRLGGPR